MTVNVMKHILSLFITTKLHYCETKESQDVSKLPEFQVWPRGRLIGWLTARCVAGQKCKSNEGEVDFYLTTELGSKTSSCLIRRASFMKVRCGAKQTGSDATLP